MELTDKTISRSNEKGFNITLKNNSESERATKEALESVLRKYDINRWVRSSNILIQDNVRPHSHPEITINTRTRTEEGLLAVFLHEQIHWIDGDEDGAIEELKTLFPNAP